MDGEVEHEEAFKKVSALRLQKTDKQASASAASAGIGGSGREEGGASAAL